MSFVNQAILIGSRALNYHCNKRQIKSNTTYDLIATQSQALKWLSSFKGYVEYQTTDYMLDYNRYRKDIVRDIKSWKHMDHKLGLKIYNKLFHNSNKIIKIKGQSIDIKFEIEIALPGSSAELILQLSSLPEFKHQIYTIADLSLLEAIKTSHMIYPFDFIKHINDLNLIRGKLNDDRSRSNSGDILYNYLFKRSIDLNRLIIHRRLEHYLIYGVPGSNLHHSIQESNENLYIFNKSKFYNHLRLNYKAFNEVEDLIKFNCVREKIMSVALEHYLLTGSESDDQLAYTKAYIGICTSLSIGWFREFAINSYYLLHQLDLDLIKIKDMILNK